MAYDRIEPFGWHADNYRAAMIAAELWNIHRDRAQHPDPFLPYDFMPVDKDVREAINREKGKAKNRVLSEKIKHFFKGYGNNQRASS